MSYNFKIEERRRKVAALLAQSMNEIIVVVIVSYSNELKLTDRYNNFI